MGNLENIFGAIIMVGLLGAGISSCTNKYNEHRDAKVQQGYVNPRMVDIRGRDLDGDGKLETVLEIGDKPYLLRDIDGEPRLSPYEIKVVENNYTQ